MGRKLFCEYGPIAYKISLFKEAKKKDFKDLRKELELNENSKVQLFSTEGNTDPNRYEHIVWLGMDKEP